MNRRTALQTLGAILLGFAVNPTIPATAMAMGEHGPVIIQVITFWDGSDELTLQREVEEALQAITAQNPGWTLGPDPLQVEVSFAPSISHVVGADGREHIRTFATEPLAREVPHLSWLDLTARELRELRFFDPIHVGGISLEPVPPTQVQVTFKLVPLFGAPAFEGVGLVRYARNNTVEELSRQLDADLKDEKDEHDQWMQRTSPV